MSSHSPLGHQGAPGADAAASPPARPSRSRTLSSVTLLAAGPGHHQTSTPSCPGQPGRAPRGWWVEAAAALSGQAKARPVSRLGCPQTLILGLGSPVHVGRGLGSEPHGVCVPRVLEGAGAGRKSRWGRRPSQRVPPGSRCVWRVSLAPGPQPVPARRVFSSVQSRPPRAVGRLLASITQPLRALS